MLKQTVVLYPKNLNSSDSNFVRERIGISFNGVWSYELYHKTEPQLKHSYFCFVLIYSTDGVTSSNFDINTAPKSTSRALVLIFKYIYIIKLYYFAAFHRLVYYDILLHFVQFSTCKKYT